MNRDTLQSKLNSWYTPASTALGATAIAIVMTRLVLGISAIENNPITAIGLETTGSWQLIGLGSIAGLTGLLYGLKHLEESNTVTVSIPFTEWDFEISTTGTFRVPFTGLNFETSSVPRAGVWTIAALSVGDVALNTQHLAVNGLPESFLVGELAELTLLLSGASVVALAAIKFDRELLSATTQFGRASRSVGRPQAVAVTLCILVVGSMVAPHIGLQGPVGTVEASSNWTETSTYNPADDVWGAHFNGDDSELQVRLYDGTDQVLAQVNPSDGTEIDRTVNNAFYGVHENGNGYSFAYADDANGDKGVAAYDSTGNRVWATPGHAGGAQPLNLMKYGQNSNQVYIQQDGGSGDVALRAIDADNGEIQWTVSRSPVALAEHPDTGTVWTVDNSDTVREVDPVDGSVVNSYTLGSSVGNTQTAALDPARDNLYIGNENGDIYKVSLGGTSVTQVYDNGDSASETSGVYKTIEYNSAADKIYFVGGYDYGAIDLTDDSVSTTTTSTQLDQISTGEFDGEVHAIVEYGENKAVTYATGVSLSETVTGTVTSCDATTYASDQSNCGDTPVANAQGQVVAVQKSQLSPDAGESYEEAAQDAIEQARNPLPSSWDSDLQLTGSDGFYRSVEGEYVSVHSPGEWGMAGWSEGADLSSPQLNPRANERIVLSAWDTSKEGMLQNSADSDQYGATVKRNIVVERLDHEDDVIDTKTLEPNKKVQYGFAGTGKTHYVVETSFQTGVYRVYPEGQQQNAITVLAGDEDQLAKTIESDLKDQSDRLSEQAKSIQAKIDDGTFVVKQFETDSNGQYSVEVPADTVSVHVQAYRMDGETLTQIENPSIQDMRDEVSNTDYNGSIAISPGPETYDVPSEAGSADATVIKFSSPPKQGLDDFLASWEEFREKLQNNSLSDASSIFTDNFDLTDDEVKDRKEDISGTFESCESDHCREIADRYEEILENQRDTEDIEESITDLEGTNEELREEIAALEQAISEAGSTVEAGDPTSSIDTGGENATATFRQAFDADLSPDDVMVVWKDADGSSTTIPEEHWSVDSSLVGDDEVVVEDYPVPSDSAGGHISVTAVSEDGVAKGGDHVQNPDFSGEMPDIRSVDASSLRPGVGESVSMTPRMDSTGHSLQSATVYDPAGNTVTSSVSEGTIEFTPSTQGAHTVRYTLTDSSGNEFVETAKVVAQESSNAWPASVRAVEGTSGTYALAGDELRDASIDVTDNGNTVEITALVPEDATPSEVHVYLDEAGVNTDGTINVRVLQGSNIDTASSVDKRVGVTLHTQRLQDNAAVYRSGGLDGGDSPIPVGSSSTGGERAQKADHTSIQTYTDQSGRASVEINNDPGWLEQRKYSLDVWLDGISFSPLMLDTPSIPMSALAEPAALTSAVTAPLGDAVGAQGVSA